MRSRSPVVGVDTFSMTADGGIATAKLSVSPSALFSSMTSIISDPSPAKSRGFTAVNGTNHVSQTERQERFHGEATTPRTDSATSSVHFRAGSWRPANDSSPRETNGSSAMVPSSEQVDALAGASDPELSEDRSTIRVARAPRKRKRTEPPIASAAAENDVGGGDTEQVTRSTTSPDPSSSRPAAMSPKRRRTGSDVINEWNERANRDHRPSLHLTTDDHSPPPTAAGPPTSNYSSTSPASPHKDDNDHAQKTTKETLQQSVEDSMGPGTRARQDGPSTDARDAEMGQEDGPSPRTDEVLGDAHADLPADANAEDEDGKPEQKKRKRQFSSRTKSGCHTCRARKKKCDEGKPICANCLRGGFECGGYGPKPPNLKSHGVSRMVLPLQSKPFDPTMRHEPFYQSSNAASAEDVHHRPAYVQYPPHPENRRYADGPPMESRYSAPYYPPAPHTWHGHERAPPPPPPQSAPQQTGPPPPPPPPPSYSLDRGGPSDYSSMAPRTAPPPPPPPSSRHAYDNGPTLPSVDHWPPPPSHSQSSLYNPSRGAPSILSNHSSNSARTIAASLSFPRPLSQQTEKDKMLRGQPFKHWLNSTLIEDRNDCRYALERFNRATQNDQHRLFLQILQPHARPTSGPQATQHIGPDGSVGTRTLISSPFNCMYGYNLHFGEDCVVESGCFFQDAADISIGNRVIIANDVQLLCLSVSVDPRKRRGGQGEATAGAIRIEDDVFIGAGAKILAYRTIGRGAVVAAGALVTKDVKEFTVVAGVPATRIRDNSESSKNLDRNRNFDIHEQNEAMRKQMIRYADSGYKLPSPRLI